MAVVKGIRRINPLDLNKNVTIGVAFPLNETNMFSGTETVQEQLRSNFLNLLLTKKGERVNLPNYGVGLQYLLFEQSIDLDILEDVIKAQAEIFMPNLEILNINSSLSEDGATAFLQVSYRSRIDGSNDAVQVNLGPGGRGDALGLQ